MVWQHLGVMLKHRKMEPQMNTDGTLPEDLMQRVIGCAIAVSNGLKAGFVE